MTAMIGGAAPGRWSGQVPGAAAASGTRAGASVSGAVAAIGPDPVHGARHDAHAFAASGLKDTLDGIPAAADTGYLGTAGIGIVPFRKPPGRKLYPDHAAFNKELSAIRAAAERAVASVKTWCMLSEEGGRYRPPISKYAEMLTAIRGLYFFSHCWMAYE